MTTTPHATLQARRWPTALFALAAYAGLCLVSVAWLTDWGQHGPAFARDYGRVQALTVGVALAGGLVVWLLRDRAMHAVLRLLARWAGHSRRRRAVSGAALVVAVVLAVGALHWAHKLDQVPGLPAAARPAAAALSRLAIEFKVGKTKVFPISPSFTVELLRLPACLLLAWCLYRWQHAGLSLRQHLLLGAAVVATLGLGLWATQDKGPMLVIALAVVVLMAGVARSLLPQHLRLGWAGAGVALAVAAAGVATLLLVLPALTPVDRLSAWRTPYASRLDYLAQITWFVQAAGPSGFGLDHTPWCGHTGTLVGRCLGMPKETQSDYTLAALAGLWGPAAATAVAAISALWLLALLRLAALAPQPRHGIDAASLAASAGGLYALMLLAQLLVTCLGNVGLLPLTGVTFPLVSWGRASLVSATLAVALVLPRVRASAGACARPAGASTTTGSLWRAVGQVAAVAAAVGLACVAWGLYQRLQDSPPTQLAQGRANPWLAISGCVRTADGTPVAGLPLLPGLHAAVCAATGSVAAINTRTTARTAARTNARTNAGSVAASHAGTAALPDDAPLRHALVQAAAHQPLAQPIVQGSVRIPVRADVLTTIDAALQARSDQLGACLTGAASAACNTLIPAALQHSYALRHEGAAVRAVSTVALRQRDGAILAASHARSACSQAQMDNSARPAGCPPEAARAMPRPGRQSQQALRAFDMVASTIKPLEADTLLSAPGGQRFLSGAPREALLRALASSDTVFFIDHLLCFQPGGDPAHCTLPGLLAQRAQAMQLATPINLLGGGAQGLPHQPHPPRLLLPGLPVDLPTWPPVGPRAAAELAAAHRCHARPADQRWRACDGEQLAAVVAPLWGQGGARSHPVAVVNLYAKLAAAARGQAQLPPPHLLAGAGQPAPVGFQPAHAALILEGLRRSPLVGTARSACTSARGPAGCTGLGLAMKTGTSLFPQHAMPVAQRAAHCQAVFTAEDDARRNAQPVPAALARGALYCALYPMKWAVLVEPDRPGTEAQITVVLVERNTRRADGRLDAGDDRAPNVAAEAALLLHAPRLAGAGAAGAAITASTVATPAPANFKQKG